MRPSTVETILRIVSTSLIPWAFTLSAVFSDSFSQLFIRDKEFLSKHKRRITYLVVGQSIFIGPLAALIYVLDYLVYEKNVRGEYVVAALSVSVLLYTMFLLSYLKMGADGYDRQIGAVKWTYASMPAIVMTLSVVLAIVSQLR